MENELQTSSGLAATVDSSAMASLAKQRADLKQFIREQLTEGLDFGTIPGTPKPTLFKPGAEKLANIFQLGSRIVRSDTQIDHERKFVMATYLIELYHLPTGKVISQCEGSSNNLERKHARKDPYDIINNLQKMSQKRAFVGAVIQACNASELFTQDLEDASQSPASPGLVTPPTPIRAPIAPAAPTHAVDHTNGVAYQVNFGKYNGRFLSEIDTKNLQNYLEFLNKNGVPTNSNAKEFCERAQVELASRSAQTVFSNGAADDAIPF